MAKAKTAVSNPGNHPVSQGAQAAAAGEGTTLAQDLAALSDTTVSDEFEQAKVSGQAQITDGQVTEAMEAASKSNAPAAVIEVLAREADQVPQSDAAKNLDVHDGLGQLGQLTKIVAPGATLNTETRRPTDAELRQAAEQSMRDLRGAAHAKIYGTQQPAINALNPTASTEKA